VTGNQRAGEGIFVAVEGADGSGKTEAVSELMRLLGQDGMPARRIVRSNPSGPPAYTGLVRGVDTLFRAGPVTPASWELLSLAAAAQYLAIMHCEIGPAVADGVIVIADSWWNKTWIRLAIEAGIHRRHTPKQGQRFRAWQQALLPVPAPGADRQFTVVINAAPQDRARWYERAGCPDTVFDDQGAPSRDPDVFASFTSCIAGELRELAARHRWPVVRNSAVMSPADVAAQIRALIYDRLQLGTDRSPGSPATPRVTSRSRAQSLGQMP
jgi:hypothetical protein